MGEAGWIRRRRDHSRRREWRGSRSVRLSFALRLLESASRANLKQIAPIVKQSHYAKAPVSAASSRAGPLGDAPLRLPET